MGGCASANSKGNTASALNKNPTENKQNSQLQKKSIVKLTPQQAQKKRQQLRRNLQQGNSQPPIINIPKIEPVGTFS